MSFFVTHMWPPAHPQHNTTNDHDNRKIDDDNHRNCTKTINNSHNNHNNHNNPGTTTMAQGEFFFISSRFLKNTKQYLQLLWTYWSYGGAQGRRWQGELGH